MELLKEVLESDPSRTADYIINAIELADVDVDIAKMIESPFRGVGTLFLTSEEETEDSFALEGGEECLAFFENMDVDLSGNFEASGYYFPATTTSDCIYYIQGHEELSVSGNALNNRRSWPVRNMVGDHTLCQFVQKSKGRNAEMSQREAQSFCENSVAPYFKQTSFGKYNVRCETRVIEFSSSFEEFQKTTSNFQLRKVREEFRKLIPDVFPDYMSKCDNDAYLMHKASVGWAGVAFLGMPSMLVNGKGAMTHMVYHHEYGHNMGFGHASDIQREENDKNLDDMPTKFRSIVTYGDRHSMMGNNGRFGTRLDFSARSKYYNNWLPASANKKVSGSETLILQASDPKSGRQPSGTVSVTYPFGTGAHAYNSIASDNEQIEYMFEYRSQFTSEEVRGREKGCVTVRLVRSMDQVREANFRISTLGNTLRHCNTKNNCPRVSGMEIPATRGDCLVEGETFTDRASGLNIKVTSIDSSTATIEINGGNGAPTNPKPTDPKPPTLPNPGIGQPKPTVPVPLPPANDRYTVVDGIDCRGSSNIEINGERFLEASYEACQTACDTTPECSGFGYVKRGAPSSGGLRGIIGNGMCYFRTGTLKTHKVDSDRYCFTKNSVTGKPGQGKPPVLPKPGQGKPPVLPKPGQGKPPVLPKPGQGKPPVLPKPGQGKPPVLPKPGQGKPPVLPKPGQGKPPVLPKPGQGKPPTLPKPGQGKPPVLPEPAQPKPPTLPKPGQGKPPVLPEPGQPKPPTLPKPGQGKPPVLPPPPRGGNNNYDRKDGIDCRGRRDLRINGNRFMEASYEACQTACDSTPQCSGFGYVKSGAPSSGGYGGYIGSGGCFFRSGSLKAKKNDSDRICFIKQGTTFRQQATAMAGYLTEFKRTENTRIKYAAFKRFRNIDVYECARLTLDVSKAQSFAYSQTSQTCLLLKYNLDFPYADIDRESFYDLYEKISLL
eukprot:Awhi_evm1s10977